MFREPASGDEALAALRGRLAREGLHIVLPLSGVAFDRVLVDGAASPHASSLTELSAGATAAILVGDGGPEFFARFQRARSRRPAAAAASDPLDDFTRARVAAAVAEVLGAAGTSYHVLYPFVGEPVALPFQRLGRAAGLPAPGPLGLQVHPIFGPWWAYRACVLAPLALTVEAPLPDPCAGCPRPCVSACPGAAVTAGGLDVARCLAHRRIDSACHASCAARLRCPVGAVHRYPDDQLAFHMRATAPTR